MISDENIRNIINKYFEKKNILTDHQISSYNDLMDNILPNIISQFFPIIIDGTNDVFKEIILNIEDINIVNPTYTENNGCSRVMTPKIARLRNYTYSSSVIVKVSIKIKIQKEGVIINYPTKYINNVLLGKIPIVVKSKHCITSNQFSDECKYDPGGYVIINGN